MGGKGVVKSEHSDCHSAFHILLERMPNQKSVDLYRSVNYPTERVSASLSRLV